MTSKERVRKALKREKPDRVPAAYNAVWEVTEKLLKHYNFDSIDKLRDKFEIDIVEAYPRYIGPELKTYKNAEGLSVKENFWGFENTTHITEVGTYGVTTKFPLKGLDSIEAIDENYTFPSTDWFDYSSIAETCEKYPDKAIIIGHEGPFQIVNNLMEMDEFFMLMLDEPEVAQYILDKMLEFELKHYRLAFEAGKGKVDILRTHDDYGTQISMLFSPEMWKQFFKENTKKLVELSHEYDVFFMQHSCGAVGPIIPELIECKVDALEPVQKTQGLEIDRLKELYDGKITFHGGVDTQWLLPNATAQEVKENAEYIINALGQKGGYILMASQAFETDVPIENIEAVYQANRYVK